MEDTQGAGGDGRRERPRLRSIIARSFLTSSLIPLITIELVLLVLYFGINRFIEENNKRALRQEVQENLGHIAASVASEIDTRLHAIAHDARGLQTLTELFYANPTWQPPPSVAAPQFAVADNGVFYKTNDNGGSSLFYAKTATIGPAQRDLAARSEVLDPLFRTAIEHQSDVVAVYFNTPDGMNRYYPFLAEVYKVFDPAMRMEDFSFYYLADAKHDPKRGAVWTGVYLDPAGQGWMTSCIAPVYRGDKLEGVLGLDVTTGNVVQSIRALKLPWKAQPLLAESEGTVMAMSPELERQLGFTARGGYDHKAPLTHEVLQPGQFNLLKLPDQGLVGQFRAILEDGGAVHELRTTQSKLIVFKARIPETGWQLLIAADEATVFAPVDALSRTSRRIGVGAVLVMLLFYGGFFVYLQRKARTLADRIALPVSKLAEATVHIARGAEGEELPSADVEELAQLTETFDVMRRDLERTRGEQLSALEAATASTRAKTEFLSNMSHELRTPMNAILGLTHLLRNAHPTPDQAERLDKISNSARHMLGLINDILDLSKVEAGKLLIEHLPFDLRGVLEEVHETFRLRAQERGVELRLVLGAGVPTAVIGDELRLRQILLNLSSNAVKFTDEGSIVLEVTVAPPKQPAGEDEPQRLRFRVKDTGIGLEPDHLARLFRPFEQADSTTTRRYGGTGLGLALTRRLVELLRGEILVESVRGEGSTFTVELPLERTNASSLPVAAPISVPSASSRQARSQVRILLAEDDRINQEVAIELLRGAGYSADVAIHGAMALDMAARTHYDLVLMDMQMPIMDGIAATRALRTITEYANTPIVAMTANVFNEDRERCLEVGMNDFVAKPVDPEQLFQTLERWLGPAHAPSVPMTAAPEARRALAERLEQVHGLDLTTGLRPVQGNWALYQRLLTSFAEGRAAAVDELRHHLDARAFSDAQRLVHTIKGSAGTLGATELKVAAASLEGALRSGERDAAALSPLVLALEAIHARLVTELRAALEGAPPSSTTKAAVAIDWPKARGVLGDLDELLARDDSDAGELFDEHRVLLEAVLGASATDLGKRIEAFDFEAALALLRSLRAAQPSLVG